MNTDFPKDNTLEEFEFITPYYGNIDFSFLSTMKNLKAIVLFDIANEMVDILIQLPAKLEKLTTTVVQYESIEYPNTPRYKDGFFEEFAKKNRDSLKSIVIKHNTFSSSEIVVESLLQLTSVIEFKMCERGKNHLQGLKILNHFSTTLESLSINEGKFGKVHLEFDDFLKITFPVLRELVLKHKSVPDSNTLELLKHFMIRHSHSLRKITLKIGSTSSLATILERSMNLEYLHFELSSSWKIKF